MNHLVTRPWFFPGLGTLLYLAGVNDELLHVIGDFWLDLGRWPQTIIVVVILAIIAYLVNDNLNERRSAYATAVRAAQVTDDEATTVEKGSNQ